MRKAEMGCRKGKRPFPSALTEPIAKEPTAPQIWPLSPSPWAVGRKMAQPLSSQPPLPGLTSFLHPAEMKTRDNYKLPTLSPHSEFISFLTFRAQPDTSMSLQCHTRQVALQCLLTRPSSEDQGVAHSSYLPPGTAPCIQKLLHECLDTEREKGATEPIPLYPV